MLTYDIAHWSTFLAAAMILNLSPGPDFTFILGHTVKSGARAGLVAAAGIWTGALCHVVLAAVGLSAVIVASAFAFSIVKWIGVAYLIWLGIQALRSSGTIGVARNVKKEQHLRAVFRQGMLIDLLNPKVAVFFLAFLPQFVVDGAGPVWAQLVLHGLLIIVTGAFVELPLVWFGAKLTDKLRSSTKAVKWLDRTLGSLLIGIGVRLALVER